MKAYLLTLVISSLFPLLCLSQHSEFEIYNNGLIYSEKTMHQLEQIVDSLNLKFKSCSLNKDLYGVPQAKGHFMIADSNTIAIAKDLDKNLPFDELIAKYPNLHVEQNQLVTKSKRSNKEIVFSETPLNLSYFIFVRDIYITEKEANNKIIEYDKDQLKGRYIYSLRGDEIQAYYFLEDFSRPKLPNKYSELFQYVDCMVDTSQRIYLKGAKYRYGFEEDEKNTPYKIALKLYEKSLKDSTDLSKDKAFLNALEEAYSHAITNVKSNFMLEHLAYKFLSSEKALALKRCRIVVGGCSQDNSPRRHAQDIAILAAESINWEIFLRAHLDIMNDNFARASDASSAWQSRKTYIKEIEELGINVPNLLIGTCLSVSNPSPNHYFADLGRIGKAILESKNIQEIENLLLSAVMDNELDLYNRINMHFVYRIYCLNLEDENLKNEKLDILQKAITTFPNVIAEQIILKK